MRSMQWQLGILGTISAFAYRHRETKKNLCRGGRSQDLPNTDFQPAVRRLKLKKKKNLVQWEQSNTTICNLVQWEIQRVHVSTLQIGHLQVVTQTQRLVVQDVCGGDTRSRYFNIGCHDLWFFCYYVSSLSCYVHMQVTVCTDMLQIVSTS